MTTPSSDKETAAKLQAILDTAVDGIIVIDSNGIVELYNGGAESIFGYSPEEALGQNVNMLMPAPYKEQHDGYISRYQETRVAAIIGKGREVKGRRKSGQIFPLYLSVSETRAGNRLLYVGMVRDLTERKELEQAMVRQSEQEREEIGQDLHDVLAQQLTALSLLATTLQHKLKQQSHDCSDAAGELVDLTRQAIDETRRLSHGLYPIELDRNGLIGALSELVDSMGKLWKLNCILKHDEIPLALDRNAAQHLYRIAQESINNSMKHGKATEVQVHLGCAGEELILTVSDNGHGDLSGTSDGMGLRIMKYRASLIDAEFKVVGIPEKGCTVVCSMRV